MLAKHNPLYLHSTLSLQLTHRSLILSIFSWRWQSSSAL